MFGDCGEACGKLGPLISDLANAGRVIAHPLLDNT